MLFALWLAATPAQALPTHFAEQMEAALSCRSEWSTAYWQGYFRQHLGAPLRNWGEADWFDAQKAQLGGNEAIEVFTSTRASRAHMVGVLLKGKLEAVRKNIEERLGYAFVPLPGPYPRYLSKFGSVLVGVSEEQTKWYCARWNLGNRP